MSLKRQHTLNSNSKVSLIFSRRVGDHTGVLSLMGHHGIFNEEVGASFLNASMDVSCQQLKTKKTQIRCIIATTATKVLSAMKFYYDRKLFSHLL